MGEPQGWPWMARIFYELTRAVDTGMQRIVDIGIGEQV